MDHTCQSSHSIVSYFGKLVVYCTGAGDGFDALWLLVGASLVDDGGGSQYCWLGSRYHGFKGHEYHQSAKDHADGEPACISMAFLKLCMVARILLSGSSDSTCTCLLLTMCCQRRVLLSMLIPRQPFMGNLVCMSWSTTYWLGLSRTPSRPACRDAQWLDE